MASTLSIEERPGLPVLPLFRGDFCRFRLEAEEKDFQLHIYFTKDRCLRMFATQKVKRSGGKPGQPEGQSESQPEGQLAGQTEGQVEG
jgi:hypothetical protein